MVIVVLPRSGGIFLFRQYLADQQLSINSLYLQRIIALTEEQGGLVEQQLLGRWKTEIAGFLKPAERQLLAGALGLEFGLEDALALKINLKARGLSPAASLLGLMQTSPALELWGRYALQNRLRFHCGIKLTAERVSREIYLYPKDHAGLAGLLDDGPFSRAVRELRPMFLGVDDLRGYSMYFPATDTAWVSALMRELGLGDWQGAELSPWQQLRFDGTRLIPGKTALETKPLPAGVLARLASHYPFPYFRHLIPLRQHTNGNFGRDPVTRRFALYVTVN